MIIKNLAIHRQKNCRNSLHRKYVTKQKTWLSFLSFVHVSHSLFRPIFGHPFLQKSCQRFFLMDSFTSKRFEHQKKQMESTKEDIEDDEPIFETCTPISLSEWKIPKKSNAICGRIFHWFWLEKTATNQKLIEECKKECTVRPWKRNFWTKERVEPIKEFIEDEKYLLIPINYALSKFKDQGVESIPDDRFLGFCDYKKELPTINIELKEQQNQTVGKELCLKDLYTFGQASLCLGTGEGKTNVAIYIYGELCQKENKRLRTLVVCHAKDLESQFADRIQSTCPDVRVGLLRDKAVKKNLEKYDFIIATVQSLTMKEKDFEKKKKEPTKPKSSKSKTSLMIMQDEGGLEPLAIKQKKLNAWEEFKMGFKYDDSFMGLFGLVIIDEAHRYASHVWSSIFPLNNCRYLLQLTANPKPGGGTEKRRDLWCGKPSFWKKKTYKGIGQVNYYEPEYERITDQYINGNNYDTTAMINNLVAVDDRNEYMAKVMLDVGAEIFAKGGVMLGVGERIDKVPHLSVMKNLIKERDPKITTCIVGGSEKELTKKEITSHNIILSTFKKLAEFFDADNIAVIVILTPDFNNLIHDQLMGRGSRMNSIFKKLLVIYFIERYSWFETKFLQRHKHFEELEFDIVLSDVKTKRGLEYLEDGPCPADKNSNKKRNSDHLDKSHMFGADSFSFKPSKKPF